MPKLISFSLILFLVSGTFLGCGGGDDSTTADIDSSANESLSTGDSSSDAGGDINNPPDRRLKSNTPNRGDSGDSGSATSTEPVSTGPAMVKNGLFPNLNPGLSSGSGTKFGGGLFPRLPGTGTDSSVAGNGGAAPPDTDPFDLGDDFVSESGDTSSSFAAPPKISLLLDAKRLFEQHNEQAAVNYVYANHLISNEARENYQLQWFPGLKEPRLFFRWGVGVVFNPKKFDGRHPVIGDPGDPDEGASRSSSGGRGAPGLGQPGSIGTGGGRGGSRSGRTYKNVDTERPDGFLLYYTGDFGEKLISFLDERRLDDDAPFYGQILKDVMEAKEPESEADDDDSSGRNNVRQRGRFGGNTIGSAGDPGDSAGRGRGRNGRGGRNPLQRTDTSVIDRCNGSIHSPET